MYVGRWKSWKATSIRGDGFVNLLVKSTQSNFFLQWGSPDGAWVDCLIKNLKYFSHMPFSHGCHSRWSGKTHWRSNLPYRSIFGRGLAQNHMSWETLCLFKTMNFIALRRPSRRNRCPCYFWICIDVIKKRTNGNWKYLRSSTRSLK